MQSLMASAQPLWRALLCSTAAIVLALAVLWGVHRPVRVLESTWQDVEAEARRGGYHLISTLELWERVQKEPDLLLVDTRQAWEYRSGHIANARNFPMAPGWWQEWRQRSVLREFLGSELTRPMVFY